MSPPALAQRGDVDPAGYARRCVEAYLRGERAPDPPADELYRQPAACFVSLKRFGELRGCIGTLEPSETTLGQEIARNAFAAAFRDPRFPPLRGDETDGLTVSVDVLSPSEATTLEGLDPRTYGVIVSADYRRGVLLPDLTGIERSEQQVDIARQKAGIGTNEPYRLARFTVDRYRERGADVQGRAGE